MSVKVRTLHVEEFEDFMRYVERAFGHSRQFFQRVYPHLYQPTSQACSWAYIVKEDGKIASHVGVYPIEVVTAGVPLKIGGIGAVSSAQHARGKGYMTRLLHHAIGEMRRMGYPISWLGGDRQRYNTFGWEVAGNIYQLTFSQRSLNRAQIQPVEVEEVLPAQALNTIRRLQTLPACHAIRPHLAHQMQKTDLRFWIAKDGYAIALGQDRWHIKIIELVSASGNEAGLLRAVLDWNYGDRVTCELSVWDKERLGRVMPYTSYWTSGNNAMYRINDLTSLLTAATPYLKKRASILQDFALSVGMQEHDRTNVTTITVEAGELNILPGQHAAPYVELSPIEAARLFLGGPAIAAQAQLPGALLALLPVPVYVGQLEHV